MTQTIDVNILCLDQELMNDVDLRTWFLFFTKVMPIPYVNEVNFKRPAALYLGGAHVKQLTNNNLVHQ